MKNLRLLVLFLVAIPIPAVAIGPGLPTLLSQARKAQTLQNYQTAVQAFLSARHQYPNAVEPAEELGQLYQSQKLYRLALPQFEDAVKLSPQQPELRLNLAQTLSYLDRNQDAVKVLTKAVELFPHNVDVVQNLGWLYYKTQQCPLGVRLLEGFLAKGYQNRNLEMTLGTLYSGLDDYADSRSHYLKAIALAPNRTAADRHFRSICRYNLSLLEKSFNHFDLAFQSIHQSLEDEDRSASWLALGELHQAQLQIPQAIQAFQRAAKADDTPLSIYDLAALEGLSGQSDLAFASARQIENFKDDSWIYNFGVTKAQFLRDMAKLYRDLWTDKGNAVDLMPRLTWGAWWKWLLDKITSTWWAWYWTQQYQQWELKLASQAEAGGNSPEAWSALIKANTEHPEVALKYLRRLRAYEAKKNPSTQALYLAEEGRLKKSPTLLAQAIELFPPEQIAEKITAEADLISLLKAQGAAVAAWYPIVNQVFKKLPGLLSNRGIALPVVDIIYGGTPNEQKVWRHAVADFSDAAQWDARPYDRPGVAYTLALDISHREGIWNLYDEHGKSVIQGIFQRDQKKETALSDIYQNILRRPW